jgi:PhzF family phenazine biosynthesis protein
MIAEIALKSSTGKEMRDESMKRPLYIVDTFTHKPFRGNPAAVCMLDHSYGSNWMQAVAAEMNLSETAFLLPIAAGKWKLRWFTPQIEVDLCGHGTLAAAHVLWHECGQSDEILEFQTRSGSLVASRAGNKVSLDFPADTPQTHPHSEQIIKALGVESLQLYRGGEDMMAVLEKSEDLHRLEPNMELLSQLDARGVIVTSISDRPEYDFISRFFAPSVGIPEDPVTGSAHCTLGPYWGERLGKSSVIGFQASRRGGVVEITLMDERIKLAGSAITTLKGELYV